MPGASQLLVAASKAVRNDGCELAPSSGLRNECSRQHLFTLVCLGRTVEASGGLCEDKRDSPALHPWKQSPTGVVI